MSKLTLPIRPGKYLREDGKIIEITKINGRWAHTVQDGSYWVAHGGFFAVRGDSQGHDLDSDYIEPAKGHPHAALMAEFAEDAKTHADPLSLWQWKDWDGVWRDWEDDVRIKSCAWAPDREYRRRPVPTPDPHAQSAAEYAKDMAVSSKAWQGWEQKEIVGIYWLELDGHPTWDAGTKYRRKEQS